MQIGSPVENSTGNLLNAYSKSRQVQLPQSFNSEKAGRIIENTVSNSAVILDLSPEAQQLVLSELRK